ncbi:hypothetical protein DWZ90_18580 [Bacteroides sp. AF36-11BH]|nr:hypothetical protein DWZ90_18580 [Bacteroides sp. AF36-11BH]
MHYSCEIHPYVSEFAYICPLNRERTLYAQFTRRKTAVNVCELLTKQPTYQPFLQSFSKFVGAIRNYHLFRCQ